MQGLLLFFFFLYYFVFHSLSRYVQGYMVQCMIPQRALLHTDDTSLPLRKEQKIHPHAFILSHPGAKIRLRDRKEEKELLQHGHTGGVGGTPLT